MPFCSPLIKMGRPFAAFAIALIWLPLNTDLVYVKLQSRRYCLNSTEVVERPSGWLASCREARSRPRKACLLSGRATPVHYSPSRAFRRANASR